MHTLGVSMQVMWCRNRAAGITPKLSLKSVSRAYAHQQQQHKDGCTFNTKPERSWAASFSPSLTLHSLRGRLCELQGRVCMPHPVTCVVSIQSLSL